MLRQFQVTNQRNSTFVPGHVRQNAAGGSNGSDGRRVAIRWRHQASLHGVAGDDIIDGHSGISHRRHSQTGRHVQQRLQDHENVRTNSGRLSRVY